MKVLLIIHAVISVLLVIVILMQRTGADGLSGLASNNMGGVMSARSAASFLVRTTVVLAACFMINSIVLANLSLKIGTGMNKKLESSKENERQVHVPIAQ